MKGFQLFYESFKSELSSQLDAIVAAAHFMLVNEDYLCVGNGDQFTEADENAGVETLPLNWNANNQIYSLKYRSRYDNLKLLLKGTVIGNLFIISVAPMNSSDAVHSVSLKPDQFVTSNWKGHYTEAFVSGQVKPLSDLLRKEIISKIREAPVKSNNQQQQPNQRDDHPGNIPPRGGPAVPSPLMDPNVQPLFPRIGVGDLDPFQRGGGGMLYDPFGPNRQQIFPGRDPMFGGLPPGAVPPGARFDPTGPPLPPTFPAKQPKYGFPPPDHFPPPGGSDPFI